MRLTKAGENQVVPLTQRAVEILSRLPRDADGRVFPMTADALDSAWDRATTEAELPHLRFHDLRHVGTTRHARRLRNPQMLKRITGHKTNAMLARYTHLFVDDVLDALDATEPARDVSLPPDQSALNAAEVRAQAKARRLAQVPAFLLQLLRHPPLETLLVQRVPRGVEEVRCQLVTAQVTQFPKHPARTDVPGETVSR